jgi:hypothetical protein
LLFILLLLVLLHAWRASRCSHGVLLCLLQLHLLMPVCSTE